MSHISPVLWQFLVKWLTNFALYPPQASKIAPQFDALYFFMVLVSLIGLTIVILLITSFSIMYRQKAHPVPVQIEGSTMLEATWTIIPLGLFLIMFVWGALIYFRVYTPPANAMNIYVVGKQWMWKAEHPGGQHEINSLHIPTGRAIQLTLISQDVFHSFSIPAFRVKREAIPGRYTTVWFEATTPGTYHLFCTQYCGTDHSHMIGDIVVLTPDDYKRWLATSTSGASLAQNGERLFASLSCTACHNARPDARGPNLANVYGSKLTLANGQSQLADEAFLRDAILNPSQHVTQGFAPIMPTYQGQVSEDGVIALVEYIKQLNSDYRIQQTTNTTSLLPENDGKATPTGQKPAGQGMVNQ
ncbi:cytochrome c oxidase subunit II [Occallatibacter savannae]|uniref:cytochrome c oxidase subunit II n=1 Tax=Occallatibacter savannae TaxID=1002691 RepID=UPI000D694FAF|nr:cytochrome c oxidase subunit II [Occallatibacter savannae]